MFNTIKKYLNTSNLVNYQDEIMNNPASIFRDQAKIYLNELEKYRYIFLGSSLNPVSSNNIAIRHKLIQSTLYYILDDFNKCESLKQEADILFFNLLHHSNLYKEGYSYFGYVRNAYDFHFFRCGYLYGTVTNDFITKITMTYCMFASPEKNVPMNETSKVHTDLVYMTNNYFTNEYSKYVMNGTYILISHKTDLYNYSKNGHIDYDFGHFSIHSKNKWIVLNKWYGGHDLKVNTKLKETYNQNVIINGSDTNEPYWRYNLISKPLYHSCKNNFHQFTMPDGISRKINIMEDRIEVTDVGGKYTSLNIDDNTKVIFMTKSKVVNSIGYHSDTYGDIKTHKLLEIYGNIRIYQILY